MAMRKSYQKPEIKQIKLVARDAVLTACKTGPGAAGSSGKDCDHPGCKKSEYGT